MYHGDIRLGDTIDLKFTTRSFTTGVPTTLAGSPVISAYVGNSVTQITAGITLTVDFDSVTGLHNIRVVATGGNGFATATNVELVITTGTVGGVSVVGEVVGSFSIEARSALMPTTAARTLDVSAGGEAGIDWANIGSPTTAQTLTGTTIAVTQKVDVETIKTNPVVNAGTVTFPTNATLASTTNITGGVITTTTNLTNLPSIPTNWLTAAGIAAGALDGKGDWLLASSYVAPTNLTAAQIATGVWQDTTAGDFTVALSIGKSIMNGVALGTGLTINAYTGNTPQTGDVFPLVSTEIADIKAKTDQLTFTVANQVDSNALSGSLSAAGVRAAVGLAAANLDTQLADLPTVAEFEARTIIAASYATPTNITAASGILLDLTQVVPTTNTAETLGDALNAARAQGFGKWAKSGTTLTLYAADGTTVVRTFTLDSATAPTSRT